MVRESMVVMSHAFVRKRDAWRHTLKYFVIRFLDNALALIDINGTKDTKAMN